MLNEEVIDEIRQVITEGEFSSRWTLIETYHSVGEIICKNFTGSRHDVLQKISPQVGKSVRSLYYATKFYEMYPVLNALPGGKNITWNKILTKYLTEGKDKDCLHEHREVISFEKCEDCGENLGRLKEVINPIE